MLLDASSTACVEQAVALCSQLGPMGPTVFMLVAVALAGFERWNAKRKLAAKEAEAERRLAEQKAEAEKVQAEAAAALAKVKTERNQHAARAQELEVKIASIRPPPMPPSSSSSPSNVPVDTE